MVHDMAIRRPEDRTGESDQCWQRIWIPFLAPTLLLIGRWVAHLCTHKIHTENQTNLIITMMILIIRKRKENFEVKRDRGLSLLAVFSDQGCLFRFLKA